MTTKAERFVTGIKFATSTIVGLGTTKIVRTIIANNVQPETTQDKITVAGGSIALGMMAADATKAYTDSRIDDLVEAITKIKANKPELTDD